MNRAERRSVAKVKNGTVAEAGELEGAVKVERVVGSPEKAPEKPPETPQERLKRLRAQVEDFERQAANSLATHHGYKGAIVALTNEIRLLEPPPAP